MIIYQYILNFKQFDLAMNSLIRSSISEKNYGYREIVEILRSA